MAHGYQLNYEAGFSKAGGRYAQDFMLSVLRHKEQHQISVNPSAMHLSIPAPATVCDWQRLYNGRGAATFKRNALERPFSHI